MRSGLPRVGEQGLEIFKRQQPLLVLTDIKMPGIDGIEVAAAHQSNGGPIHGSYYHHWTRRDGIGHQRLAVWRHQILLPSQSMMRPCLLL